VIAARRLKKLADTNRDLKLKLKNAQCTKEDADIFNQEGYTLALHMGACIVKCQGVDETCISQCMADLVHYSKPCAQCFGALPGCVATKCLGDCLDVKDNPMPCAECMETAVPMCVEGFLGCTGFDEQGQQSAAAVVEKKKALHKELSGCMMKHHYVRGAFAGEKSDAALEKEKAEELELIEQKLKLKKAAVQKELLQKVALDGDNIKLKESKLGEMMLGEKKKRVAAQQCTDADKSTFETTGAAAVGL